MPADALRAASSASGSNIGSALSSRNWLSSNINFREARTVILPEVKGFGLSKIRTMIRTRKWFWQSGTPLEVAGREV